MDPVQIAFGFILGAATGVGLIFVWSLGMAAGMADEAQPETRTVDLNQIDFDEELFALWAERGGMN